MVVRGERAKLKSYGCLRKQLLVGCIYKGKSVPVSMYVSAFRMRALASSFMTSIFA